jgi:hypothetical protein
MAMLLYWADYVGKHVILLSSRSYLQFIATEICSKLDTRYSAINPLKPKREKRKWVGSAFNREKQS